MCYNLISIKYLLFLRRPENKFELLYFGTCGRRFRLSVFLKISGFSGESMHIKNFLRGNPARELSATITTTGTTK